MQRSAIKSFAFIGLFAALSRFRFSINQRLFSAINSINQLKVLVDWLFMSTRSLFSTNTTTTIDNFLSHLGQEKGRTLGKLSIHFISLFKGNVPLIEAVIPLLGCRIHWLSVLVSATTTWFRFYNRNKIL